MRTFGVNVGLDGKGLMSWIYQSVLRLVMLWLADHSVCRVERPDMLVYRAEAKVATDFMIVSDLTDLDDPIVQFDAHVEEAISRMSTRLEFHVKAQSYGSTGNQRQHGALAYIPLSRYFAVERDRG